MKLPLAYYGHPILRKKASPVEEINEEIKQLVEDMIETMVASNGIGIAAPQVKRSLRIFITQCPIPGEDEEWVEGTLRVYINPEIISISDEGTVMEEGCLSIPKVHGDVARPYRTVVRALDIDGNPFEIEVTGLESHCVLHENDHINGVLFIDRMEKTARQELEPELRNVKKEYYLPSKKNG
ncbi:MAG: peptide deformylase [Chlamydiia bacterium]|nr:peptide deformylase [Chlamydiia bacterium]